MNGIVILLWIISVVMDYLHWKEMKKWLICANNIIYDNCVLEIDNGNTIININHNITETKNDEINTNKFELANQQKRKYIK